MIEDFAKPTDTKALSSIPLQFLVYVSKSNEPCDERPDFTKETRPKGSCIGIPPGGTYFDRIIVRAGGPSKRWRKDVVIVVVFVVAVVCVCVETVYLRLVDWKEKRKTKLYYELKLYRLWAWNSFFPFCYRLLSRFSYRLMLFRLRISKFIIFSRPLRPGTSRIKTLKLDASTNICR